MLSITEYPYCASLWVKIDQLKQLKGYTMMFQCISCDLWLCLAFFLCQLLLLPIFHVRNASALMQENFRRVTTDRKSQFVFNNLRRKLTLVISHTF